MHDEAGVTYFQLKKGSMEMYCASGYWMQLETAFMLGIDDGDSPNFWHTHWPEGQQEMSSVKTSTMGWWWK